MGRSPGSFKRKTTRARNGVPGENADGAGPSENPSPAKRARTSGPVKKEEAVKKEGEEAYFGRFEINPVAD